MSETLRWLERARISPEAVRDALWTLRDPEQARMAALALRAVGPAGAGALAEALEVPEARVRAVVIETAALLPSLTAALADRVDQEPLPWLRRALVRAVAPRSPARARAWSCAPDLTVRAEALRACPKDEASASLAAAALRELDPGGRADPADRVVRVVRVEVAWHACTILAVYPVADTAEILRSLSRSPNPFLASQAALALVAGGGRAAPSMGRLFDPAVPSDLQGMTKLRDEDPRDLELAEIGLLRGAEPLLLRAALGRLSSSPATSAAIAAALSHPLPEVRKLALTALDRRRDDPVWEAYERMEAEEPEPELREALLWTLGRRSEPPSLRPLIRAACRERSPSREVAIQALLARVKRTARARTQEAGEALVSRLRDGSLRERGLAAEALGRFSDPQTAQALRSALPQAPRELRARIEESLQRR
ncbi:MAG: hypothetical protein EA397_13015 [Deltaproteobacteria bacterium]|nr:MAG: hypothetical protein EA397_13015 [Deltaproteobacteria bacterium]